MLAPYISMQAWLKLSGLQGRKVRAKAQVLIVASARDGTLLLLLILPLL